MRPGGENIGENGSAIGCLRSVKTIADFQRLLSLGFALLHVMLLAGLEP